MGILCKTNSWIKVVVAAVECLQHTKSNKEMSKNFESEHFRLLEKVCTTKSADPKCDFVVAYVGTREM